MDVLNSPSQVMAFASTLLLFLLSVNRALDVPPFEDTEDTENDTQNPFDNVMQAQSEPSFDIETVTRAALHNFRLSSVFSPRSSSLYTI